MTPQRDAFIRSDGANKNYGTHDSLLIQKVGNKGAARILVAFPQSGIADSLGADSLVSASLELTIKRTGTDWGTTGRAVAVHRMTRAWTEAGATWSCANDLNLGNSKADCTGNTWTMTGATPPFAATAVAQSVISNGRSGVVSFDVTTDVRAFLANPASNQGWLLKLAAEAQTGTVVFHSKESATKPRLTLTIYRKPTVPAQAPDLIPEWMYSDTNVVDGSDAIAAPFTKRIVVVQFQDAATLAEREAAVEAVDGEVAGGVPIAGGEGQYFLRVTDEDGELLATKAEVLRALPQVASAFVNVAGEDQWRVPDDGNNWKTANWAVVPRLANSIAFTYAQTAINAPMAWGCVTGESPVPVAVVDVDFRVGTVSSDLFKDLQGMSRRTPASGLDGDGHGAGVAGLLGAKGNNHEEMTGILWDADIRLYDYSNHQVPTNAVPRARWASPIAATVQRAAYDGAKVINVSSGINWKPTDLPVGQGTLRHRRARDAMAWAMRGALQTMARRGYRPLIVVGAGNSGVDGSWNGFPLARDAFPDQVLVVGGSEPNNLLLDDGPTAISNTGQYIDVVAPGSLVPTFTASGVIAGIASGTSLSAPLVSGIAGLLLSFDPRLTTADVRKFIVDGAVRANRTIIKDGHTYYQADAYEALKLAAERQGAPLCGNRIWADGGTVYASRGAGSEALFSPSGGERGVFALAAHHGGRQIDMLAWSGPNLAYTFSGTQWSLSSEVPQTAANQSGVSNSLWGLSHDGKQEVFVDNTLFNTARILRVQLYDSTGAITQTASDKVLPQLQAYPDTTTIPGIGRGTNDEYLLPWAVAYSPTGDHAVVAVSVHRTTATFNGSEGPCPWAAEPEAPPYKCFDSITYEKQAVKADLWEYPLPTGEPRFITTLSNTVVGSVAISEDGAQMIITEGMKHEKYDALPSGPEGCSPNGPRTYGYCVEANRTESYATCSVTYRSLETGELVAPRVSTLHACELPVGTMSSVKAKSLKRNRSLMRHRN